VTEMMKSSCFVLSALLYLATVTHSVAADNYTDCFTGPPSKRVTPCTAIIDDPATTDVDRSTALDNRSIGLMIAGKHEEAIADLNRSLEIIPNSARALNGRAWTLFRWKNTTEGMDDVNRALEIDPTFAAAWDTRAHMYQMLGNFEKAFNEYEAAVGFGGEPMIRTYQCGLRERGFYQGPVDGIYSAMMRTALRNCAFTKTCDPLPENEFQEECDLLAS
jgi:tetratricopeptide (TPR) repeat protein